MVLIPFSGQCRLMDVPGLVTDVRASLMLVVLFCRAHRYV